MCPVPAAKWVRAAGRCAASHCPVRKGHHHVLIALPDRNRSRLPRSAEREAPVADQGQVVVAPPGDARREPGPEHLRHVVGERAAERFLVGGRRQVPDALGQHLAGEFLHQRRDRLQQRADLLFSRQRCIELVHVVLGHAAQPGEPAGMVRSDTRQGGGGHAAVSEQAGARQRMRPAAGPADRHELPDAERIQDRRHVGGRAGDLPAGLRCRAAVTGPGVQNRAQAARARLGDHRLVERDPAGRAVVKDHGQAIGRARRQRLQDAAVWPAHRERRLLVTVRHPDSISDRKPCFLVVSQ
jgi:hypothetical protein